MNLSQIYIAMSIVVLAVVSILVFVVSKNKNEKRLSPLASFAFAFVLAGILFGENRFIGYGLMGIGVTLAVVDMLSKSKAR